MFEKHAWPHFISIFILISSVLISSVLWAAPFCYAQQAKKPFTVADEIGLASFGAQDGGQAEAVGFSPDGSYFAVDTERGRLDLKCIEDSLRFYRSQDVKAFLEHSSESRPPSPVWVVNRSTDEDGPSISDWRWLADSSGVAFLERTVGGNKRLVLADLRKRTVEQLTSAMETVEAFDLRDRNHYVYTVLGLGKAQAERRAPAMVGTGRNLFELVLPDDPKILQIARHQQQHLWAVVQGRRFEVKHKGAPIVPGGSLALSPDGRSLVTQMTVQDVPVSWETLYRPPFPSERGTNRIHAGHSESLHQYVLIDLEMGSVRALTDAPVGNDFGGQWAVVFGGPSWSIDGREILLPGTFLKSKEGAPSRPCVAVMDLASNTSTCVEMLKGRDESGTRREEGFHHVKDAQFAPNSGGHRIMVSFYNRDWSVESTEYRCMADGSWRVVGQTKGERAVGLNGFEVAVTQGLNEPPLLVASNIETSRVIWDPNPQLKNFALGEVSVYTWKDKDGQESKAGLYKPVDYKPGQRYPLLIQTHGFKESEFEPSGLFSTAFAARALAAVGIIVLQVDERCPSDTPSEGPCAVSRYESATIQLVSEGLVDPQRIGIIGFSRTCYYVMEMLTTGSSLHLKAASITDGGIVTYLQYMLTFGVGGGAKEADSIIGAKPLGEGLQQWLKRSPGFNLDKINTPLMVVGLGPVSTLFMWEPYAGLRYLQKPVDLIMLKTDEHVLTNPELRLASQGGSVDWFRFWLQDYEDPDPAKASQYIRWRELRKLQEENERKLTTSQADAR